MSKQAIHLAEIFSQLPLVEKLQLLELFFRNVKEETLKKDGEEEKRRKAAQLLLKDYENDDELTAFSILDGEDIYETK